MMCQVTSEHQFSAAIREDIKFAVSLRNSKGKERVPTRQDLCSLSHDGKRFSFGFDTNQIGAYKVGKETLLQMFIHATRWWSGSRERM